MNQRGMINPLLLTVIVLTLITVALIGFGAWAFVNYQDHKNNVDSKVAQAVEVAKKDQQAQDEKSFTEREKLPTRQLVGPDDLGRVTFDYPKTWSVYVERDGSGGTYTVYLHPKVVNSISQKQLNAVTVSVEDRGYETVLASLRATIAKGELKATPVTIHEQKGTRLDGAFSKSVQGAAVLFKVRDKTLRIQANNQDFLGDFNNIILKSLQFNP